MSRRAPIRLRDADANLVQRVADKLGLEFAQVLHIVILLGLAELGEKPLDVLISQLRSK